MFDPADVEGLRLRSPFYQQPEPERQAERNETKQPSQWNWTGGLRQLFCLGDHFRLSRFLLHRCGFSDWLLFLAGSDRNQRNCCQVFRCRFGGFRGNGHIRRLRELKSAPLWISELLSKVIAWIEPCPQRLRLGSRPFLKVNDGGEARQLSGSQLSESAGVSGRPRWDTRDPLDEQAFIVNVINFLQTSPDWDDTAVVILYDDSDGWYDHQLGPIVNQSTSPADALTGPGACGDGSTALPGIDSGNPHAQGRCGYGPRQPLSRSLSLGPRKLRGQYGHQPNLGHPLRRGQLAGRPTSWRRVV